MEHNYTLIADFTRYEVEISPSTQYGYFADNKYGDEGNEGGLWFEKNRLVDFDGVLQLPKQVIRAIRTLGFIVPRDFE